MFNEILALDKVVTLLSILLFTSYWLVLFRIKSRTNVFMVLFLCSLLNIILFTIIITNQRNLQEIILIIVLNMLALLFLLYFMVSRGQTLEYYPQRSLYFYYLLMSVVSIVFLGFFTTKVNRFLLEDYSMKTRRNLEQNYSISETINVNKSNFEKLKSMGLVDGEIPENQIENSTNTRKNGTSLIEGLIQKRISEAVIFFAGLMSLIALFAVRTKRVPFNFSWIYKLKGMLGFNR